ncbi:MAG: methylenetetrahydrofolate--tRNA-(uracil(54)-C(5))-methyltransferase (FADH(2)-oxidizing) TrmFO [Planctomycetes bacterium]|mgnify:CR=1 FL=1|jgi:methylenetetrahydrofolate--tRNA-(uracil-5-)-methyltransferase|nr:methylenetetrahydrofolate--tRNA-(uracil(54)-C(5))-methyltransferase (FADH(2)-oxidizing) TrmFO [Planctomycetota bacterium]MBT4028885.1 methylenetetrahydrofolate--tRNA-(uracil(54)-C(5))-methyltransferase (FADH(2)-oxidizing) TrmFO [Planctomycetota bacterium]MBT4559555.1 methylenetetrahydrofolate--tRNA-(uracil(54)-C(5))-methyltransferase (FADH(2)-oxidizing) TrmFO [Planctomycetota bacterium]MBT5100886.1 methylenetetrahydrofolate--tRNA-(uracil(54)-C(5))-methyltransferase (FADH(2)-oxidizing) TrmFO [
MDSLPIVGAGLAGSEAALQLADAGIPVRLFEMRPGTPTAAHRTGDAAEIVCSNSLGSFLPDRAGGVLQNELRALGCKLLPIAEAHAVPAGQALAVNRDTFAAAVTAELEAHPKIDLIRQEVKCIPADDFVILASGPLTSDALASDIAKISGEENLSFFDAIAPVVTDASLDKSIIFAASRWRPEEDDYLNIPIDKEQYLALIDGLIFGEKHDLKGFEAADPRAKQFFERCLPVEVLAARGKESLRFGPLRPVGLDDPRTRRRPYAVVQMRRENKQGTMWNLVGFQTNLAYGEQEKLLRALPGMQNAEFVRLGSMHRNTFVCAPKLLHSTLEWRTRQGLFLAGQLTGMEGYLGNIGSGLLAARGVLARIEGREPQKLPVETLLGALTFHISSATASSFQPMKAEFGILPPLDWKKRTKEERRQANADRSKKALADFLAAL